MEKQLKWIIDIILKFALLVGGAIFVFYAVQQVVLNMGKEMIKGSIETQKQIMQNMKNAQSASPNAPSSATATNLVFVKGKTLKECAPTNYFNEAALRCTKDHYEPPQNGNH